MKHKRIVHGLLAGILVLVVGAFAQVSAQNVTQGYKADGTLENGMVVRFKSGVSGTVQSLTQKDELSMLGVTVSSSDSPVSLSDPNSTTQVFVATYGQYPVLVSTQNGTIKAGDRLSISSIDGIAMKADGHHQVVLGKALQDFADTSNAESHIKVGGATVAIGRILVDVGVARNPAYTGDAVPGVPTFMVKAAKAVTDKPITALRLYSGLAILFAAIIVAGIVLFAGARSGMNAVGRNPLAKKSIFKGMISVVLMALIIVFLGLVALYLLLKI